MANPGLAEAQNQLQNDPRFAPFFEKEFSVTGYIQKLLSHPTQAAPNTSSGTGSSSNVPQMLPSVELGKAVSDLSAAIRGQVTSQKRMLLVQALHLTHMEQWLDTIRNNVLEFGSHFKQVRQTLREPFEALSAKGNQVEKASRASRMLQSCHMILVLTSKLKACIATDKLETKNEVEESTTNLANSDVDLSLAADLVSEILSLYESESLKGIEIVDKEIPWIMETKQTLQQLAQTWILNFASSNPSSSSTNSSLQIPSLVIAIHILYSLHTLDQAIFTVTKSWFSSVFDRIHNTFTEAKVQPKPSKSSIFAHTIIEQANRPTHTAKESEVLKNQIWTNLEELFRISLPCLLDRLVALHGGLVQLWKRLQQQNVSTQFKSSNPSSSGQGLENQDRLFSAPQFQLSGRYPTYPIFTSHILGDPSLYSDMPALRAALCAPDQVDIAQCIWLQVVEKHLTETITKSVKQKKIFEQLMGQDYPRFLRLCQAFVERMSSKFLSSHHTLQHCLSSSPPASSSTGSSQFETWIGYPIWSRLSTNMQLVESEYQKILVTQFFTPINAQFAQESQTSKSYSDSSVSNNSDQLAIWNSFGILGTASSVTIGGHVLLPGESVLHNPPQSTSNKSQSPSQVGGRWVGGSPYICRWLTIIKSHFDSLQAAAPPLFKILLPKFLLSLHKSIKLLVLKVEEVASHENEAYQVVDKPPIQQKFNIAIYNTLASIHSFITSYFQKPIVSWIAIHHAYFDDQKALSHSKLPASDLVLQDFHTSLNSLCSTALVHIVQPIFSNVLKLIENTFFIDMQQGDWATTPTNPSKSITSSLYIRNIHRIVSHFTSSILPLFTTRVVLPNPSNTTIQNDSSKFTESMVHQLSTSIGIRMINCFIFSASLVRPMTDTVKLRLVNDIAQLEQSVQSFNQFSKLSPSTFSTLSAFRELIFTDNSTIVDTCRQLQAMTLTERQNVSGLHAALSQLNPEIVWQLIMSRAPLRELPPVHILQGQSIRQYSDWIESRSTQDIWNAVRKSITQIPSNEVEISNETKSIISAIENVAPILMELSQEFTISTAP